MARAVLLNRLNVERITVLVCVDRLVLGSVVLKDRLDVIASTDEPDVGNDHENAEHTINDHEGKTVASNEILDPVRCKRRGKDEDRHGDRHRDHHRDDDLFSPYLFVFAPSSLG